jgi:hypothetical protein
MSPIFLDSKECGIKNAMQEKFLLWLLKYSNVTCNKFTTADAFSSVLSNQLIATSLVS